MNHFKNRFGIPMNLQFFAEPEDGGSAIDSNEPGVKENENTPTIEELLAKISKIEAEKAKLQNEKDTASSEAASFKKQLRAKMSADEQVEAAKAEAEAAKDAKIQELETKFRLIDYSKRFMGVGMDEQTATELASLSGEIEEPDKYVSILGEFVKAIKKKAGEDAIETIIKNNPSIKAGNGSEDRSLSSIEMAKAYNNRRNGVNQDILDLY